MNGPLWLRVTWVLTRVQCDPEATQWSLPTCAEGSQTLCEAARVRQVGRDCCGSSEGGSSEQVPLAALEQGPGVQAHVALVFLIISPCASVPVPTCDHTAQHSYPVQFWGFPFSPWAPTPPRPPGTGRKPGRGFPGAKRGLWGENTNGTVSAQLLGTWLTTAL